jgi:hypothetical protein
MNLGAIYDELDPVDRRLIHYCSSIKLNIIPFMKLERVFELMVRNITHCKSGLFYDNDSGYKFIIDNEIKRSQRILKLIEDVL